MGVAIHLAQDAGAHRRKAYGQTLTPKEELWKRAFWCVELASFQGTFAEKVNLPRRTGYWCAWTEWSAPLWVDLAPFKTKSTNPLCSREFLLTLFTSFDLDWPVDCDDEYWDNLDPEKRFKQPPNKPSLITGFILYLKLHKILALSLRTIVSDL